MFEQAIAELETMGIPYVENEDGSMTIDISQADKTDVVQIVGFLNDTGLTYTIDANTIEVASLGEPLEEEEPMEGELETPTDTEGMF